MDSNLKEVLNQLIESYRVLPKAKAEIIEFAGYMEALNNEIETNLQSLSPNCTFVNPECKPKYTYETLRTYIATLQIMLDDSKEILTEYEKILLKNQIRAIFIDDEEVCENTTAVCPRCYKRFNFNPDKLIKLQDGLCSYGLYTVCSNCGRTVKVGGC